MHNIDDLYHHGSVHMHTHNIDDLYQRVGCIGKDRQFYICTYIADAKKLVSSPGSPIFVHATLNSWGHIGPEKKAHYMHMTTKF